VAGCGYDRPAGGYWSGPGRAWLAALGLPAVSRELAGDDLGLIGARRERIGRPDGGSAGAPGPAGGSGCSPSCPAPGRLPRWSSSLRPARPAGSPRARTPASRAGLTPAVRGSDRVARYGHIWKGGSVRLRWVLCEAAQTARRSPQFAAGFQAIARRRGNKIATTATARKPPTRARHLLAGAGHAAAPQPAAPQTAPR
jgi:transposase